MLKKQESGAVVEKTMTQEMVPHISSARSPSQTRANAEPPVVPHSEPAPALTVATAEPAALPETSPETVTISSAEKTAAFLEFRRSYAGGTMIDEQKLALKQKYAQAKALGEEANGHRQAVTAIKVRLEKVTMQNMMIQGIGQKPDTDLVHEEQQLREDMDVKRTAYKNAFNRLKELKQEIEHMQHLVENARIKMQRDFEAWLVEWKSRGSVERASLSMAQGSTSVAPQQTEVKNLELPSMVIPVIKSAWNKPTAPVAITEMASSINHRSRPSSSKDHRVSLSAMSSSTATKFTASTNDDIVSSVLSRAGAVLTDKSVEQEIAAFYKARDAVRAAGRCASRNM